MFSRTQVCYRTLAVAVVTALIAIPIPVATAADVSSGPSGPAAWKSATSLVGASGVSISGMTPAADAGNDIGTAGPLPASPVAESLDFATDPADVFSLEIPAGQRLRVTLASNPSLLLADAYLFNGTATSIDSDVPLAGTSSDDAAEVFVFDNTGASALPCYLAVSAAAGAGEYTLSYELFASPTGADDEIPGLLITSDPITVTTSADAILDRDDVYAVPVEVGERLVIDYTDGASLNGDVYVYAPGSTSLGADVPMWGSATDGDEYFYVDVLSGMAGTYYVDVRAVAGSGPYTIVMWTTPLPAGAWENVGDAVAIATASGSLSALVGTSNDRNDVWYMDLVAGQRVSLGLTGDAGTDFDLYAYGPNTADIFTASPAVFSYGLDSTESIVLDVKTTGRYFFEVRAFSGAGTYDLKWLRDLTPVPGDAVRLDGSNRYETALKLSRETFASGSSEYAVLATGDNFPDALSAASLSGVYDCPLLLTPTRSLYGGVVTELARLGARHVFIVGGPNAVSAACEQALWSSGKTTLRLSGNNRYETATKVAEHVIARQGANWPGTAFVARGDNFADALSIGPLAFATGYPIVLTRSGDLPGETRALMTSRHVNDVVIAGGKSAVSAAVESTIRALPGMLTITRLEGNDRYLTAKAIADYGVKHQWVSEGYVGVATGVNFPDGLGGGVVCGKNGGVLLLTNPNTLSTPVAAFMTAHWGEVMVVEVFGGVAAVKPVVVTTLNAYIP